MVWKIHIAAKSVSTGVSIKWLDGLYFWHNWKFCLHILHIFVLCSVSQSCPTLRNNPLDCSPLGSSVHGIPQTRILEWVAISSSRGSSRPRDWTLMSCVSCIGRQILYHWATGEAPYLSLLPPLAQICAGEEVHSIYITLHFVHSVAPFYSC